MSINKEIERKFLIETLPPQFQSLTPRRVRQGYAIVAKDIELRLRSNGGMYSQTIKRGGGLQRDEVEIELTEKQFTALYPLTEGRVVEKERYILNEDGYEMVVDVFHGALTGLMTAEIEFTSVAESQAFTPPKWFGDEVTEDERFKNKNLAVFGKP